MNSFSKQISYYMVRIYHPETKQLISEYMSHRKITHIKVFKRYCDEHGFMPWNIKIHKITEKRIIDIETFIANSKKLSRNSELIKPQVRSKKLK